MLTLFIHSAHPCAHRILPEDRILFVNSYWLDKIRSGEKTVEIRGFRCDQKMLWLSPCRSSKATIKVHVSRCLGPLSAAEWDEMREQHKVVGDRNYGEKTFAWEFSDVLILEPPIDFVRKKGPIIYQVGPGP